MIRTKQVIFIEAPTATLEIVPIELINDVPAPTSKAQQTSLIELGQVEPVRLQPTQDGRFDIVDGRRRVANAKAARIETIIALVEKLTDDQATLYSLVQMGRTPNPMMEAKEIAKLLRTRTQQQVGKLLGITQAMVSQRVGLLDLVLELQTRLETGEMTLTAARAAKKLDMASQKELAKLDKITVQAANDMLRQYQSEMVDLSSIDIPSADAAPVQPVKISISLAEAARLAAGQEITVKVDGCAVIITAL